MGVASVFCAVPEFVAGEQVRLTKRWIWWMSTKSLPTYRIAWSMPPLIDLGVYVTDQRILFIGHIMRLFKQQFSVWYKPHADDDVLEAISVSRGSFPYVEITSRAPGGRFWLRAPRCRMRLYMREPEQFHRAVEDLVIP